MNFIQQNGNLYMRQFVSHHDLGSPCFLKKLKHQGDVFFHLSLLYLRYKCRSIRFPWWLQVSFVSGRGKSHHWECSSACLRLPLCPPHMQMCNYFL